MEYLIKVDDRIIPSDIITGYEADYQKIDGKGTKRNLKAGMRRQVIANKFKVNVTFCSELNQSQVSEILELFSKDAATVECFYPKTGKYVKIKAYFPNFKIKIKEIKGETIFNNVVYHPFSCSIIEM